jgi:cytoskeletal protein CcmA (bactofilin family)
MARSVILLLLVVLHAAPAGAQEAGETLVLTGSFARDLYLAGGRVDFPGEAEADVVVAARALWVSGIIRGDLLAAASRLLVTGRVVDDARVAARRVGLDGEVGDGFVAAGEVIRLSAASRVGGAAWLAGRRVDVAGRVGHDLRAAAVRVRISGTIEGDVVLAARDIELLPSARIVGNLTYWSSQEARVAQGAQVSGRIVRRQPEYLDRAGRVLTVLSVITRVVFVVNLFVAGVILYLLFPRLTVSAALTVGRRPWTSFGVGLAVLTLTPLAVLSLALTVIGIPLALALVWLYVGALLLGLVTAAFYLADLALRPVARTRWPSRGARIAALALAVLVLALVRFIPIAGPLVLLLALVFGVGALVVRLTRGYSGLADEEGARP